MRTVVVTGGTVRLGLAIAEGLRAAGWRVLTTSHRPDAGADLVADLSEPMGAARLYAAALQRLDGVPPAALVNNAALFSGKPEALSAVNFVSPQKLTMLMASREEGVGAVVNVLDAAVLAGAEAVGASRPAAYTRAKRDLLDYTRRAAAMFVGSLRVNAVAPGPVLAPSAVRERAAACPLGRPEPSDVAAAVAYLLSARATTGCVVPVDGGGWCG